MSERQSLLEYYKKLKTLRETKQEQKNSMKT